MPRSDKEDPSKSNLSNLSKLKDVLTVSRVEKYLPPPLTRLSQFGVMYILELYYYSLDELGVVQLSWCVVIDSKPGILLPEVSCRGSLSAL